MVSVRDIGRILDPAKARPTYLKIHNLRVYPRMFPVAPQLISLSIEA